MARKEISWKTRGMNRDMSVSAFNPEFAFENRNLRLVTNEGNTMMSWVNEKGITDLSILVDVGSFTANKTGLTGEVIGVAELNHKLVLFSVDENSSSKDCYIYVIWRLEDNDYDFSGKILYKGNLGFDTSHPIEALVSYESETVQKVYWTDGKNQPRMINIAIEGNYYGRPSYVFDFVPQLQLNETVTVRKIFGSGEFPAGVIQYAFTYYNKYGQESNIFHTTPLQYISYVDRGGSPESKIANSFEITVTNVDKNFDYLRIYSILRTSKDATPLCKRVQDLEILKDYSILHFTDNGLQGDAIDPTELLYKGGEEIIAETIEQKDGTLFLGNIEVGRPTLQSLKTEIMEAASLSSITSARHYNLVSKAPFNYINTLSSPEGATYEGAAGFKSGEWYRLGVQFQYKNGKWSEPCWLGDIQQKQIPSIAINKNPNTYINVPEFNCKFTDGAADVFEHLYDAGYRKARPVFALPSMLDRTRLLQGVACPTMYRKVDRYADANGTDSSVWSEGSEEGRLYAQSSWLFRTYNYNIERDGSIAKNGGGYVTSYGKLPSQFHTYNGTVNDRPTATIGGTTIISPYLRGTEIMGAFDDGHAFYVDQGFVTVHSPELVFDESFNSVDFDGCWLNRVGRVSLDRTYGDIDIQTSTPPIGSDAGGFVHKSIVTNGNAALITAPFYNDYLVDDNKGANPMTYHAYNTSSPAVDFPTYMWHKNGSLNNDVARDNRSAELLKKKISNYRLGKTTFEKASYSFSSDGVTMQLFNSDVLSLIKVGNHAYMGNVDTMLTPTKPSPHYIIGSPWRKGVDTDFESPCYYCLKLKDPNDSSSRAGVWTLKQSSGTWKWECNKGDATDVGDAVKGVDQWREGISMKYKSTPHLVVSLDGDVIYTNMSSADDSSLMLVEVLRDYDSNTFMGGQTEDALKANTWIPCGPAVSFTEDTSSLTINYKWGDTYIQNFECLKTYAFTPEDKNQVIEIASFACETRVNIDGRYDRNRMQTSNLNMSPQNFNLLNPVYSQMDNFFSYKILDKNDYENTVYPNTITWTKTKENGADVDLWTNITLANLLEMDGNKGEVTKLIRLNNQLLTFQDKGIAQILYNENTQISTTEGVPIEIANSEKVQGKRYYSDTIGCSNKWSVMQTPMGIYFMDSNDKSIYLFNGQLTNLSVTGGMNTWSKQNIPSSDVKWNTSSFETFKTCYDKLNQDVLFINKDIALAYSERFGCFTSFYDYGGAPFLEYLDGMSLWVKEGTIYGHQMGSYCVFFGGIKPFHMTLVANQEPQLDKIFTNLEFRANTEEEGYYDKNSFTPYLPFNTLEVWNEYQHGILKLSNKNKGNTWAHGLQNGILSRKFRIWRCDIPRDNAPLDKKTEKSMGICRMKVSPLDRIRNTWAYIKLSKDTTNFDIMQRIEIHDVVASYFG